MEGLNLPRNGTVQFIGFEILSSFAGLLLRVLVFCSPLDGAKVHGF